MSVFVKQKKLISGLWFSIFIISHLFLALATGEGHIYPDSGGYLKIDEEATNFKFGTFSLIGESLRPWVAVGFITFFYNFGILVTVQSLFFALSLFLVAHALSVLFKGIPASSIFLTIYVLSLVPEISQFNYTVLSESLTLSLTAFAIAFFLFYLEKQNKLYIWASIFFIFVASVIRPYLIIFLAFLLCYYILSRKTYRIVFTGIIFFSLLLYPLFINQKISEYWAGGSSSGLSRGVYTYFYLVDTSNQIEEATITLPTDAPDCLNNIKIFNNGPYASASRLNEYCESGTIWLNNEFNTWYLYFIITNPSISLKIMKRYVQEVGYGTDYTNNTFDAQTDTYIPKDTKHLLPFSISSIFFSTSEMKHSHFPVLIFWILLGLITNLIFTISYLVRLVAQRNSSKTQNQSNDIVNIFSILGVLSLMINILLHPGGEIYRINLPSVFSILVGSVINLFFLFDKSRRI